MRLLSSVIVIAICAFLNSCNGHSRSEDSAIKLIQDTSKWVTIPFSKQRSLYLDSAYTRTDLYSQEEVETLKILFDALQKDNRGLNLKNYKIQLVPFKSPVGEKQVFINCFCANRENDWKTRLVLVVDGGDCFFNVTINLSKKIVGEIFVNGQA